MDVLRLQLRLENGKMYEPCVRVESLRSWSPTRRISNTYRWTVELSPFPFLRWTVPERLAQSTPGARNLTVQDGASKVRKCEIGEVGECGCLLQRSGRILLHQLSERICGVPDRVM